MDRNHRFFTSTATTRLSLFLPFRFADHHSPMFTFSSKLHLCATLLVSSPSNATHNQTAPHLLRAGRLLGPDVRALADAAPPTLVLFRRGDADLIERVPRRAFATLQMCSTTDMPFLDLAAALAEVGVAAGLLLGRVVVWLRGLAATQARGGRRNLGTLGLGELRRGGPGRALVGSREPLPLVLASAATLEVRVACEQGLSRA